MSIGANSQNEMASSSDATAFGGGSSPAPTPPPGDRSYRRGRGKECRAGDFACSCVLSHTGDLYELPAKTIEAVDDFQVPAGFRGGKTREASFMNSIGVYVEPIDEKTVPCKYFCLASASCRQQKTVIPSKGRDRADINKLPFDQHTYQEKEIKRIPLKLK